MGLLLRFGESLSPSFEFRNEKIISVTTDTATNLIGEQLKIDTMTPIVHFHVIYPEPLIDSEGVALVDSDGVPLIGAGTGDIRLLEHGSAVRLYDVDGQYEKIRALYFVDYVERIAKDQYRINCVSFIGRLEERKCVGRFYNNIPLPDVLNYIIGNEFLYQISPYLQNRAIYGYMPNATARNTLYYLMLAYGIGIYHDGENIMFRPVGQVGDATVIPDERIYIDGNVTYPKPPSVVQVVSRKWDVSQYAEYEERVVFDNTDTGIAAINEIVTVDFVYTDYRVEDAAPENPLYTEFEDSPQMVQSAPGQFRIFTGVGKLILICPPMQEKIVEVRNDSVNVERVVSVTDDYFINESNAENVANRLMDYYSNGTVIESAVVLDGEQCGNQYGFNNAFGESETAAMVSMNTVYSAINKANCKLVSGLDTSIDFPYKNYIEYGQSQTIDLTELKSQGVTAISILLVGGGQAGTDGSDGQNGADEINDYYHTSGGFGGAMGLGGAGGKTKYFELDITDIDELSLTCGAGGESSGELGGVTSISYTKNGQTITVDTDDGDIYNSGTLNPFSGTSYGAAGEDGYAGGNGGHGGRIMAARLVDYDFEYIVEAGGEEPYCFVSDSLEPDSGGTARNRYFTLIEEAVGGKPSEGNYGGNLIMYAGSYGGTDMYYSFGGAGGGGGAYLAAGEGGEAVFEKWR